MNRHCILCIIFLTLFNTPAASQTEVYESFSNLPLSERARIQEVLRDGGYYQGEVDGEWGPKTALSLNSATVNLRSMGYNYDLAQATSAREFLQFILTDGGYEVLAGEGAEYDSYTADLPLVAQNVNQITPGVFHPVDRKFKVTAVLGIIREDNPFRNGQCRANLGRYSDGNATVDVEIFQSFDWWGIYLFSDEPFSRTLFAPALLAPGVVEKKDEKFRTVFGNSNPMWMGLLEDYNSLIFKEDGTGSTIEFLVPDWHGALKKMSECAFREEQHHKERFCRTLADWQRYGASKDYCDGY